MNFTQAPHGFQEALGQHPTYQKKQHLLSCAFSFSAPCHDFIPKLKSNSVKTIQVTEPELSSRPAQTIYKSNSRFEFSSDHIKISKIEAGEINFNNVFYIYLNISNSLSFDLESI
jgi:hypothetical protein